MVRRLSLLRQYIYLYFLCMTKGAKVFYTVTASAGLGNKLFNHCRRATLLILLGSQTHTKRDWLSKTKSEHETGYMHAESLAL